MSHIYLPCPRTVLACCALLATPALADDIRSAAEHCEADDLVETTPSSDFTALDGGAVVRHEPTGLEWRRCPEGMAWTGSGCDGSATTMDWQSALGHADNEAEWRLPNINELRSIVERCAAEPAINAVAFPDTPTSNFWSASPFAGASGSAWYVNFDLGGDDRNVKSGGRRVRLVRGGQ